MSLRVLLSYAWPYRANLIMCASLMLIETFASLAIPWLGGRFTGGVLSGQSMEVEKLLLPMLALFGTQSVLRFGTSCILSRTTQRIIADLRIRIYDHLQALPLGFFDEQRHGDVLALITFEVAQLSSFITGTLLGFLPLLLTIVGSITVMFHLNSKLAALLAVLMPIYFIVLKIVGRRLRGLSSQIQKSQATAVAIVDENLSMLAAIKAFTREPAETRRYRDQILKVRDLSNQEQRASAGIGPAIQLIASASVLIFLWLASGPASTANMTPAALVSFLLYAAVLIRPLGALADSYGQTLMARGTLERLKSVLDVRPEFAHEGIRSLHLAGGDIQFCNVSFAYPGRTPALRNVNLQIKSGEIVAITGENGAGKTTLVHLLLRLYEPDRGLIRISGHDIKDVSLHSLRSQIGIVPQRVQLMNASVRDNIGYGRPDALFADIEAAARAAEAHAFIRRLPQGYDTLIGDQGTRLSGGQCQRIALARALLKDAPILVLDEATAMFDPEGEQSVIENCRQALAGRTVIVITHRPASLALADRVIKLAVAQVASTDVASPDPQHIFASIRTG